MGWVERVVANVGDGAKPICRQANRIFRPISRIIKRTGKMVHMGGDFNFKSRGAL